MFEASKATMRRNFDSRFANRYFVGDGIDIGCGQDTIWRYREFYPKMTSCRAWDLPDGDAVLLEGIPNESLDFIHSSHSLEHMSDPIEALRRWVEVLKKGGHMILLLPDEDMFEQGKWPSPYAGTDHITSWTIYKHNSWNVQFSYNITEVFSDFFELEILKIEKLDATYLYNEEAMDQTRLPIGECAIEVILRKKTEEELKRGGRLPPERVFTFST